MSDHRIVHIEVPVADVGRSQSFYEGLFGWKMKPFGQDYVLVNPPAGPSGALYALGAAGNPGVVVIYVSTPDIPSTLARVQQLGGQVVQPQTEIPGTGWYALFKDPTGNVIGLFTPAGEGSD